MAALQNIRNHAALLITIIAVALLAFVVGDFLTSTSSIVGKSRNNVGSVDGRTISIQEFQDKEKSFSDVIKAQYQRAGQPAPSDGEIRNFVWNRFLNTSLMENEMEEIGLTVTSEELNDATRGGMSPMLRQIPIFFNENNQFDVNRMRQFFAFIDKPTTSDMSNEEIAAQQQNRAYWAYWEEQIKQQMEQDKLVSLVLNAVSSPKAIADILNKMQEEEKDVLVMKKVFAEQELTSEISKAEMRDKYEQVKNEKFKTNGYRSIKVALYSVTPSQQDYDDTQAAASEIRESMKKANEEEVRSLFAEASSQQYPYYVTYRSANKIDAPFKDFAFGAAKDSVSAVQYSGGHFIMAKQMDDVKTCADSANISIILLADQDKDALNKKADSVLAVLKGGAKFEDVANSTSIDPQTAANGGEVGWIQEGSQFAIADFDTKVFNAKKGEVFSFDAEGNPVKFIVKVNDLTAPVKKAKIAVLGMKLEPSNETDKEIFQRANRFVVENKTLEAYEKAADSLGIQLRNIPNIEKNQTDLYVIPDSREIVKWAWNPETKLGSVSKVFEFQDLYVTAAVYDAVDEDAEYIPFDNESVQAEVEVLAKNAARAKIILADMEGKPVESADTLKAVRFSHNYVSGLGNEPNAVGAIAATKVGAETKPIVGNMGVYKFKVLAANPTSSSKIEVETLNQKVRSQVFSGFFKSLQDAAEIEDNRANFY